MLRKNVSLSNVHLKMLDPLLKKHEGNLSAAMRDIIDFTGYVTKNFGSIEAAKDMLTQKNHNREQCVNRIYGVTIPLTMFKWLLAARDGVLPPVDEVSQMFLPHNVNIYNLDVVNKTINEQVSLLNWPVSVNINNENGNTIVQISGPDPLINRFKAILIALFFANAPTPQKVGSMTNYPNSIYLKMVESNSREESLENIHEQFAKNPVA